MKRIVSFGLPIALVLAFMLGLGVSVLSQSAPAPKPKSISNQPSTTSEPGKVDRKDDADTPVKPALNTTEIPLPKPVSTREEPLGRVEQHVISPEDIRFYEAPTHIYKLDALMYTITNQGNNRCLEVSFNISMSSAELAVEIEARKGDKLKDSLSSIFDGKDFTDIMSVGAKMEIKDLVIMSLNDILRTGRVLDVYYKSFLVY